MKNNLKVLTILKSDEQMSDNFNFVCKIKGLYRNKIYALSAILFYKRATERPRLIQIIK